MPTRSLRPTSTPLCPRAQPSTSPCRRAFRAQFGLPRAVSSSAPSKDRVRRSPGRSVCSFATQALRYTVLIPGRCRTSWGFGYLTSSARTRSTSAITNRQSMATVINKRIQDDRSSIRPHLLCVSTARRSLVTACAGPGRQVFVAWVVGPTAQSSEPIRSHTRKRSADSLPPRGRLLSWPPSHSFSKRKTHPRQDFQRRWVQEITSTIHL
jgi:hypothetical protein